ncbi:hypothetical protein [Solimonas marina]|uniref:Uncharacterized protein n=1 Tax=Solimonas marina TaxID=2714601 RepID=A0A969W7C8_9GAMM|nr:hypothetical protein [Solimonas marina]NKF20869.1 hypothetical protein [Solimonas marina]
MNSTTIPALSAPKDGADSDSLDALLNHLQGNGPDVQADAALARFSEARLRAIEFGARARAEDCLHNVQSLARLLTQALRSDEQAPVSDTLAAVQHLEQLARDSERWALIAEHAVMYRKQRPVAEEVAQRWMHWARHLGEWPDAKRG